MMISPIWFSRGCAAIVWLTTSLAAAHAIHDVDPAQQSHSRLAPEQLSVEDLVQRYSLTGDDHLLEQGWLLIEPELAKPDPDQSVLLSAAWLAQASHQFERATRILRSLTRAAPGNGQAWMLLATTAMASGDRDTARRACKRLVLTVSPVVAMACAARLADSGAEQERAYQRISSLSTENLEPSLRAWIDATLGDLAANLQRHDDAIRWYQRSIMLSPSVQTRVALLDSLLATQRYSEVLHSVQTGEAVPGLALRRLLAREALNHDTSAAVEQMADRFARWATAGDYRHAREMAMFYLYVKENPGMAYQLAVKNANMQREREDLELLEQARLALAQSSQ